MFHDSGRFAPYGRSLRPQTNCSVSVVDVIYSISRYDHELLSFFSLSPGSYLTERMPTLFYWMNSSICPFVLIRETLLLLIMRKPNHFIIVTRTDITDLLSFCINFSAPEFA